MKILLLGSGGREHALAWKLSQSPLCEKLLIGPGSDAMASLGELVALDILDPAAVAEAAVIHGVELCVVGPDAPLALGVADALRDKGVLVFGPGLAGAKLESSKDFAKRFMLRHGVATAAAQTHTDYDKALAYAVSRGLPVVVKADGLAAGKGVTVCESQSQLEVALADCLKKKVFGDAGACVLIEDFLEGEEVSLLCFCDGKHLVPMVGVQDHKRIDDGDRGPNTGGMGTYSPAPVLSDSVLAEVQTRVLEPTLRGFEAEGLDFRGCLYVGLMIGPKGPKVVEYNARFGDPETQVVVPRMDFDLVEVMLDCARGQLNASKLKWKADACACVVLSSKGYPGPFENGKAIQGLPEAAAMEGVVIFHAGTRGKDGFVSQGGRVLGVCATGRDLRAAIGRAYEAVGKIHFEGMHYRKDIGHRALMRVS